MEMSGVSCWTKSFVKFSEAGDDKEAVLRSRGWVLDIGSIMSCMSRIAVLKCLLSISEAKREE